MNIAHRTPAEKNSEAREEADLISKMVSHLIDQSTRTLHGKSLDSIKKAGGPNRLENEGIWWLHRLAIAQNLGYQSEIDTSARSALNARMPAQAIADVTGISRQAVSRKYQQSKH